MQALAHFGAAVVHAHAAVGVDRDHRTRLVELRGGEADAELDRRERQAFFDHAVLGIPVCDGLAACTVVAALGQLRHQRVQDVVFDLHAVRRGVALVLTIRHTVQVGQSHIERVHAEVAGNVTHDGFDQQHALRPAKTAERGVALGVGFAAVRGDVQVAQKVSVVGVEDRAVGHRAAQVGAVAAMHQLHRIEPQHAASRIKAHLPVVAEGVAFAGDQDVVAPVQSHLDRPTELVRGERRPHGQMPGLRFFATEAATHASAHHPHLRQRDVQRVRHPVLHLARVLRAAVDQPVAVVLRNRVRDLAFQIEVFLPADLQRALQAVRCVCQGLRCIAALHRDLGQHKAARLQGLAGVQKGRCLRGLQPHVPSGLARLGVAVAHHQAHDLAHVHELRPGKNGLVVHKGGQQRVTRNVLRGDRAHHTGRGQHRLQVHGDQLRVGQGAHQRRRVQRALDQRQVVDVAGAALDLCGGAFVEAVGAGGWGIRVHARSSKRTVACPVLSNQARRSS